MKRVLTIQLPEGVAAPAAARRQLAGVDSGWDEGVFEVAQLLTSELVSNAVRHGRPPVQLTVHTDPDRLTVEVSDAGTTALAASTVADAVMPAPGAIGGLGLPLLQRLAERWGSTLREDGHGAVRHTVWFTLSHRP